MSHVYFNFVYMWFNYNPQHDTYQWGNPSQITVFHLYAVSPTALSDFVYQALGRWLHTDNIHNAAKRRAKPLSVINDVWTCSKYSTLINTFRLIPALLPTYCRCRGWLSHLITLTRYKPPRWGIGPSKSPLPVQHATFITDKHPCPWQYSNPQAQQAKGRKSTH
jgi:hypothetical protein